MSFCLCILHCYIIQCVFFQFCMSFSYVPVSFRHRRAQMLMEFTPSSGPMTPVSHHFPPYMLCTWGTPRVAVSVDGTPGTPGTQHGWNRRSQGSQPCCCACTGKPRISDGEAMPCRRSKRKSCQMKWCLTLTGMSFYDLGIRWPAKKHMKSCGQHWHPVRIPTVATDIHMSAPSSMCPAMSLPAKAARTPARYCQDCIKVLQSPPQLPQLHSNFWANFLGDGLVSGGKKGPVGHWTETEEMETIFGALTSFQVSVILLALNPFFIRVHQFQWFCRTMLCADHAKAAVGRFSCVCEINDAARKTPWWGQQARRRPQWHLYLLVDLRSI